jgi:CheY-like chemotaxis protein
MAVILVIDDSASCLQAIAQTLETAGHEVLTAGSGTEGLQILRQRAPDLILTDIYMPEKDGLEVIQAARQSSPGVQLIAMSGMVPELDMLPAAKLLGAVQTLSKPFGPERLLGIVNRVLGTRAQNGAEATPGGAPQSGPGRSRNRAKALK